MKRGSGHGRNNRTVDGQNQPVQSSGPVPKWPTAGDRMVAGDDEARKDNMLAVVDVIHHHYNGDVDYFNLLQKKQELTI